MTNGDDFNAGLLAFLQRATTPYHAVAEMGAILSAHNFIQIDSANSAVPSGWSRDDLTPGQGYWTTRNDSSIVAFRLGSSASEPGMRMLGAHTDSPCLKVKPNPDLRSADCQLLGMEIYGGALLAPWFDRDLALAGRVTLTNPQSSELTSCLVDFKRPVGSVPSLAIHLDRNANEGKSIDRQRDMRMLLAPYDSDKPTAFAECLHQQVVLEHPDLKDWRILSWDISAYDIQSPALTGLDAHYISSARLDNLLSCYIGLQALIESDGEQNTLLVCNDHEEVGSQSAIGAQGPFLRDCLWQLASSTSNPGVNAYAQWVSQSMMISVDNAHAQHPNFAEKHDAQHNPRMNAGPVIKINSNQRYATNDQSMAQFKLCCEQAGVPWQVFLVRNDMGCGSTIGPITASEVGVTTLDVGCAQLAMHSPRELCGSRDPLMMKQALTCFLNQPVLHTNR